MPLYLIEAPVLPVISTVDAKKHLRIDHSDDDDFIDGLVEAVTLHVEGRDGWLRRALVSQTWELRSEGFCNPIDIPLPPLIAVESVKYYDADSALQTASTDLYEVVGAGGIEKAKIRLLSGQSWPATAYQRAESVIIRFRAGYVDTADSPASGNVPAPIIAGLKLMLGTLYEMRETIVVGQSVVRMQDAAEALLSPYRIFE